MTTSIPAALKRLGFYGNKIDLTRHSRKEAPSLIHREDPTWIGLYGLAVLTCDWYLIIFELKNKIITIISSITSVSFFRCAKIVSFFRFL